MILLGLMERKLREFDKDKTELYKEVSDIIRQRFEAMRDMIRDQECQLNWWVLREHVDRGTQTPLEEKKKYSEAAVQAACRTVVVYAAPTKYKLGKMWNWLQEDNKMQIVGIRWLLQEHRRGKEHSSLVIYLKDETSAGQLRMGKKMFRATEHEWDRPVADKGKNKR